MRRSLLALLLVFPTLAAAQDRGAVAVHELVRGLGTTVRVLMIGAHPDDEDTQLITWLARGRQVETAYLSLTRGDGGQNLIGNELGEALGVIRTEELLAARRVDGGRQYFTRAFDFGFSKTADETFTHWPKDTLLRDVVAIVRAFRPHVIVSVFSGTPRDGHGHHQVAGILAREVFDAAADSVRFPAAAVGGLAAWTPLKFYRLARSPGGVIDSSATLRFNVGEYNALLGRSYAEIAGESRSQHLSQGFGSLQPKGVRWAAVRREASRVNEGTDAMAERDLFDGIDTTWARVAAAAPTAEQRAALDSIPATLEQARAALRSASPDGVVPPLATLARLLARVAERRCEGATDATRCVGASDDLAATALAASTRVSRALLEAAGVSVEAFAQRELVALGDSMPVTVEIHNRGRVPVTVVSAAVQSRGQPGRAAGETARVELQPDSALQLPRWLGGYELTKPWWRARPRRGDLFQLESVGVRRLGPVTAGDTSGRIATPPWTPAPEMVAGEDRVRHGWASAELEIAGARVVADAVPVVYRYADPARGEIRRPVAVVPAINVLLERGVEYMRANSPVRRQVRVHLASALTTPWTGRVELRLPAGLRADSAQRTVTVPARGEADVYFQVQGTLEEMVVPYEAIAHTADTRYGISFDNGYVPIEYPHIRTQRFYRSAQTYISAVQVDYPPEMRVAYVPGVGDNVAPMLQQLGIPVTLVAADTIAAADLSRFSTLVIGTRAYEASSALRASAGKVLDFARRGGTVVAQYGQYEMTAPGIMPFPITLARPANRVTEEDAPVEVVQRDARVLTAPNRIADADFANWIQERALYMPATFDPRYQAPLSMHDEGEPAQRGGILVAPLGRGTYVYTTLSFFRQLPAGIPGPARLFVNLLAARPSASAAAIP